jgi:hypothetical protein
VETKIPPRATIVLLISDTFLLISGEAKKPKM